MEQALPPEGCALVRLFLRDLVAYARAAGGPVDVRGFMHEWRALKTAAFGRGRLGKGINNLNVSLRQKEELRDAGVDIGDGQGER